MSERISTDEILLMSEEREDHAGGTLALEPGDSLMLTHTWSLAKIFLRSTVILFSFSTTIVSFVWIKAYFALYWETEWLEEDYYPNLTGFCLMPLYALPYVNFTFPQIVLACLHEPRI